MMRPKVSVREAARRAGISEGRWRQIAKGYQSVAGGFHAPVTAPPDTLAKMARVVGVSDSELQEAGRSDAANEMRYLDEVTRDDWRLQALRERPGLSLADYSDVELAQELLNRMVIRSGTPTNPMGDLDLEDDEPPYGLAARPRRVPPNE